MFTFITNLFSVLWKFPQAISIIKTIMDIVGSEAVKEVLRLVSETVQSVKIEKPTTTDSMTDRTRFIERLRERIGNRMLRIYPNNSADQSVQTP